MGWFTSSSSHKHSSSRPGYARSYAGSSYSSSSRHGHHSSTSRYKRSPRDGYIAYLYDKFRHLIRKLIHYAKRHPYKVFFMVIMPLVSGGVLTKLARQFGVNLPDMGGGQRGGALGGLMGNSSHGGGGGYYGSEGYGERGMGAGAGGGGLQSIASGIGNVASLAKMAQAFM